MEKKVPYAKGQKMEESLRAYFLKAGYYVVRGVPFVFEGFDVTDIDIWIYGRASSVSREITIVDSKNKKTPQAIERIFWVEGLRQAIKANSAIVATTDRRQEVKDFGKKMGIQVLDGAFLSKIERPEENIELRLTDEELSSRIDNYQFAKVDGNWKQRLNESKGLLADGLTFDNCNKWLEHAQFFAEQSIARPSQREMAVRCVYLICSFVAIAIDYCLREYSFLEQKERSSLIAEGFTYGSKGKTGMNEVLNIAMGLVEQYSASGKEISMQVKRNVNSSLANLNTTILGEFFSRVDVAKSIFATARELESAAMNRDYTSISELSLDSKSLIYCFLDYWK
ncbi:MAG: hypothetical protein ACRCU9_15485, partial [Iodobacter sp.]